MRKLPYSLNYFKHLVIISFAPIHKNTHVSESCFNKAFSATMCGMQYLLLCFRGILKSGVLAGRRSNTAAVRQHWRSVTFPFPARAEKWQFDSNSKLLKTKVVFIFNKPVFFVFFFAKMARWPFHFYVWIRLIYSIDPFAFLDILVRKGCVSC